MITLSDFRDDSVISIRLYIDGEHQIDMDMQPNVDQQELGVAVANFNDFSLVDMRDILRTAAGSLTRLLQRHEGIEADPADLEVIEKEEPPTPSGWPF